MTVAGLAAVSLMLTVAAAVVVGKQQQLFCPLLLEVSGLIHD